jgi:hypothetical protein
VPSIATIPTLTSPARAQSKSTPEKSSEIACSWRARKRAIVAWSGTWFAVMTRKATSSEQRRSIPRAERTPIE